MANYLVTGVAGFIASHVSRLLLEAGHTVVGVDNLNNAYDVRLKQWRLEMLKPYESFHFAQASITDHATLKTIWQNSDSFDAVINLAARAGVRQSVADPYGYIDTNLSGTTILLELCRAFEVKKFVVASSSSLYGEHNQIPYVEDSDTNHPISPYAATKKAAEAMCYPYYTLHGIDITIFRYFTVYGPAGRPDMSIFRFIKWIDEGQPVTIFGDGKQSRDFTYIDDIARGTIAGIAPHGYEIINLGSDKPVVLMDIIHTIEDKLGKKANLQFEPRHPADVTTTWANIDKAKRLLNWSPRTNYQDGLQKTIDWYIENRAWARNIQT